MIYQKRKRTNSAGLRLWLGVVGAWDAMLRISQADMVEVESKHKQVVLTVVIGFQARLQGQRQHVITECLQEQVDNMVY